MKIFILLAICGFMNGQETVVNTEVDAFKEASSCLRAVEIVQKDPQLVKTCTQLKVVCKERDLK